MERKPPFGEDGEHPDIPRSQVFLFGAFSFNVDRALTALAEVPRFRWQAKAPRTQRPRIGGQTHPSVKPLELVRWRFRLGTPDSGVVLDPFLGFGTTAEAARLEGVRCIWIERETDSLPLIETRPKRGTSA